MLRSERPAALDARFAEMQELSARFFAGAEGQEGMLAFAEKRRPAWAQES
jgi:methylglutaconyl-CoA hydratase